MMPTPEGNGLNGAVRKYLTFDRLLLALVLASQVTGLWKDQEHSNTNQAAQLGALEARVVAAESTYARRDVLEVQLQAMLNRLIAIEQEMKRR